MIAVTLAHFRGTDPLMMILEALAGAEPHYDFHSKQGWVIRRPDLFHSCFMLTGSWMRRRETGREKRMKRKNMMMMYTARSSKIKTRCVLTWLMSVSGPGIHGYICSRSTRNILEYKKPTMVFGPEWIIHIGYNFSPPQFTLPSPAKSCSIFKIQLILLCCCIPCDLTGPWVFPIVYNCVHICKENTRELNVFTSELDLRKENG